MDNDIDIAGCAKKVRNKSTEEKSRIRIGFGSET